MRQRTAPGSSKLTQPILAAGSSWGLRRPLWGFPSFLKRRDLRSALILLKPKRSCATGSGVKKHENPEPYQRAARELRTRPENTIVIEDNPSGVYSAKLAGCKVIAYPNGYTKDMDFSRADKIISSMKEIDEALLNRVYKS